MRGNNLTPIITLAALKQLYDMVANEDANHATRNTTHYPHYRIVLRETGNWKPICKVNRLSQVAVMFDNLVQGEAF